MTKIRESKVGWIYPCDGDVFYFDRYKDLTIESDYMVVEDEALLVQNAVADMIRGKIGGEG